MSKITRRLASIDAFRAITMLLMIFVNDLELDVNVPVWLEHAKEGEDRLGLADTVFPAFLFIVGLSIPLAITAGRERGATRMETFLHILRRSFALLAMGFFLVNYEEFTKEGPALVSRFGFLLIITIAFFFIWLVYPKDWSAARKWLFRGIGIAALVFMAVIYKGGTPEHPMWLKPHWWGILGLIGWSYLSCAILYFVVGDRIPILAVLFLYFLGFSILAHTTEPSWLHYFSLGSGGLSGFTMAGIITTVYYRQMTQKAKAEKGLLILAAWVPVLLVAGFLVRPIGGIAKLGVTPSWILICTGISVGCVAILGYVVDLRDKHNWYRLIRPAGTITLTCYLLPDIHFAILKLLGPSAQLPEAIRSGWVGVGKSFVFAFLIVLLTGVFEKKKIRLSV